MTNQGLSLFQEGHCHWQKTFNGNNAKRPTKQNKHTKKGNKTKDCKAPGQESCHSAHGRPSLEMETLKRKSTEHEPTDCAFHLENTQIS